MVPRYNEETPCTQQTHRVGDVELFKIIVLQSWPVRKSSGKSFGDLATKIPTTSYDAYEGDRNHVIKILLGKQSTSPGWFVQDEVHLSHSGESSKHS